MPVAMLKKLPPAMARQWEKVYQIAKKKYGEQRAAKIAWSSVKKSYKKQKGKWVAKNAILSLTLMKSGWLFPDYKFEFEITNDIWDDDNNRADPGLLSRLANHGKISKVGDVDHEYMCKKLNKMDIRSSLTEDTGTEGLYYLDSYKFENNKILGVIGMNKHHPLYNKYLNLHKKGKYLNVSAEFRNADIEEDGIISYADELGWSITNFPANKNTKYLGISSQNLIEMNHEVYEQ